jgi:multidrug efflux pump subunit AcrA (membrane-fusion protein)
VITLRNANKGDFVLPASGDPSASQRSPDQSSARAAPIFVVARTDIVRIYVDVPGAEADYVNKGNQATVRIPDLNDTEIQASVTRTSWALNVKSRTLRAEIDLPNTDARMRPGLYSYGKVVIQRKGVMAVPVATVTEIGNRICCYLLEDGKAVLATVQPGISDGTWIELVQIRHRKPGQPESTAVWGKPTGQEKVIVGDLSELSDGQEVKVFDDKE